MKLLIEFELPENDIVKFKDSEGKDVVIITPSLERFLIKELGRKLKSMTNKRGERS